MKTLTLTPEEANIVYATLRTALAVALDRQEDAEKFPSEFDLQTADLEVFLLNRVLDKLAV